MTEVELELQLDPEGRTTFDPSKIVDDVDAESSGRARKSMLQMDYSSKTVLTSLADESESILFGDNAEKRDEFLDELLFDCEVR